MAKVIAQRMTADIKGDFVVFLIGMRFNSFWRVRSWWPVFTAMPGMLRELEKRPESGFLGAHFMLLGPRMPAVLQYWRSFEDLERYARAKDAKHFPAWVKFNQTIGSNGRVGIWHETYQVAAGQYDTIYNNLPLFGLAKVSRAVPAAGYKSSARGRLTGEEAPDGVTAG